MVTHKFSIKQIVLFFIVPMLIAIFGFEIQPVEKESSRAEQTVFAGQPHKSVADFKTQNPKSDNFQIWLYLGLALAGIVTALILIGTSPLLITAVVLGLLGYIGFAVFMFMRYIENGFELEPYWWWILLGLTALGIVGAIAVAGLSLASGLIIGLLITVGVSVVAAFFLFMLIIAFFKALFSGFRRK